MNIVVSCTRFLFQILFYTETGLVDQHYRADDDDSTMLDPFEQAETIPLGGSALMIKGHMFSW